MTKGRPIIIQLRKSMLFSPVRYCRAIALGGVPIGVAMPPVLAAIGIHKTSALMPMSPLGAEATIGPSSASIITVVAVLDMNMENTAVISINPSMMNLGWWPKGRSKTRARLLSSSYFDAAMAKANPPINRMIIGEENALKISVYFMSSPRSCPAGGVRNKCRPLSEIMISSSAMIRIEVAKTGTGSSTHNRQQAEILPAGDVVLGLDLRWVWHQSASSIPRRVSQSKSVI